MGFFSLDFLDFAFSPHFSRLPSAAILRRVSVTYSCLVSTTEDFLCVILCLAVAPSCVFVRSALGVRRVSLACDRVLVWYNVVTTDERTLDTMYILKSGVVSIEQSCRRKKKTRRRKNGLRTSRTWKRYFSRDLRPREIDQKIIILVIKTEEALVHENDSFLFHSYTDEAAQLHKNHLGKPRKRRVCSSDIELLLEKKKSERVNGKNGEAVEFEPIFSDVIPVLFYLTDDSSLMSDFSASRPPVLVS